MIRGSAEYRELPIDAGSPSQLRSSAEYTLSWGVGSSSWGPIRVDFSKCEKQWVNGPVEVADKPYLLAWNERVACRAYKKSRVVVGDQECYQEIETFPYLEAATQNNDLMQTPLPFTLRGFGLWQGRSVSEILKAAAANGELSIQHLANDVLEARVEAEPMLVFRFSARHGLELVGFELVEQGTALFAMESEGLVPLPNGQYLPMEIRTTATTPGKNLRIMGVVKLDSVAACDGFSDATFTIQIAPGGWVNDHVLGLGHTRLAGSPAVLERRILDQVTQTSSYEPRRRTEELPRRPTVQALLAVALILIFFLICRYRIRARSRARATLSGVLVLGLSLASNGVVAQEPGAQLISEAFGSQLYNCGVNASAFLLHYFAVGLPTVDIGRLLGAGDSWEAPISVESIGALMERRGLFVTAYQRVTTLDDVERIAESGPVLLHYKSVRYPSGHFTVYLGKTNAGLCILVDPGVSVSILDRDKLADFLHKNLSGVAIAISRNIGSISNPIQPSGRQEGAGESKLPPDRGVAYSMQSERVKASNWEFVAQGEIQAIDLNIRNDGACAVMLAGAKGSCGCFKGASIVGREKLDSDQVAALRLEFYASKLRSISGQIVVLTWLEDSGGSRRTVIELEAEAGGGEVGRLSAVAFPRGLILERQPNGVLVGHLFVLYPESGELEFVEVPDALSIAGVGARGSLKGMLVMELTFTANSPVSNTSEIVLSAMDEEGKSQKLVVPVLQLDATR